MESSTCLWEILVPTTRNNGHPIRTRYHRVWDKKVREIAGGLTVLTVVKGQWVSKNGELFAERMIPVRIAATQEQIKVIGEMTMKYYDQLAVLVYKISSEVLMFQVTKEKETKENVD